MKSLAELQAIRNRMIDQVNMRKDDNIDTRIVVGMATCGIAAGARPVMLEFIEELKRRGVDSLKTVYSKEPPFITGGERTPGSLSFVPGAVGLIIAGEVIKDLARIGHN